jgi:hypothetical protein
MEPGLEWSRSIILRKLIFERNFALDLSSRPSNSLTRDRAGVAGGGWLVSAALAPLSLATASL